MKRLLMLLALLLVIGGFYHSTLRTNFREVIPGELYGSAQLEGSDLQSFVQQHGIRTVISLRQAAPDEDWYREELATVADLGLAHHSIGMYASSLHVDQVIELYERLRAAERPLLVHCRAGIDRTGLASVIGLLADGRFGLEETRDRAGGRYAALRGQTIGGSFLDQYAAWLAARGADHAPALLEEWLRSDYQDPTGNIHFLVHPIAGKTWYKPFGRFEEGEKFRIDRSGLTHLELDGWAFDARAGSLLAGLRVLIDGQPVETVEYGIHSPWLLGDFGNPQILDAGWAARHPLGRIGDGCHALTFAFTRLDGSNWTSPPAGRICIE